MPGVPVGAIAERRLIHRLMAANAVSPAAGVVLDNLHWVEQRRLSRLVALDVIRKENGGRYYLSAPALADRMRSRRLRLVVAMMIVVLMMLAAAAVVAPSAK
ncbi:MAG TPA: hypothetical protein VGJ29_14105 [Vicinamibacterales bacterium]|jgi:hypothetical protein